MTVWKLALFFDKVKAHYIPESLYQDIVDELFTRFLDKPAEVKDKDLAWYDVGGAVMMDANEYNWELPQGLKFGTRACHFDYMYDALKTAPVREVNGKQYYKIHGWLHCIVFTPEQRDYLLSQCDKNLHFYSEGAMLDNIEFERRMAEINKDGVKIVHVPRIDLPKDSN